MLPSPVYREAMTATVAAGAAPGERLRAPSPAPARTVAHLVVSLKLRLMANALTRSVWQLVALAASTTSGLAAVTILLAALGATSRTDPTLAAAWLVVGGAALVTAWWLVPLVAFGVDSTVSAEVLRPYGLRRRDVVLGLAAAGLVGVPGVLTLLLVLGSTVVWRESPAALLASLPAGALAVATCVVGSRTWTTLLAPVRSSRRFRDASALSLLVPLAVAVPLVGWLARGPAAWSAVSVERVAEAVSWTPVGTVWAVPSAVAEGRPGTAALHLGLAVGVLVVLVVLWARGLDRASVGPASRSGGGPRAAGTRHRSRLLSGASAARDPLGRLLAAVLGGPAAAVAARSLTYWVRDPRYLGALAVVPFLPLVLALLDRGDGTLVLLACPLAAFLVGWTISADVAYDHTAFWVHVAAGVSGRADRLGRAVAATVVGVPVTAVVVLGVVWSTGRRADLPAVTGVTFGVLLTALGLSSVVSARFVYPVPRPGDGPFSSPQGSAVGDLTTQAGGWGVLLLLVLPETAVALVAVVRGDLVLGWAACALGLGLGAFWWSAGVRLGAHVLDRRAPELLQQVATTR